MAMSRRAFIGATAGVVTLAGMAIAAPAFRPRNSIASWLRSQLPGIDIASQDLDRFAEDVLSHWKLPGYKRRLVFLLMERSALRAVAPASVLESYERQSRWVLTKFLASSNMFDDDWDGRRLSYEYFSDPYEVGCSNRIARTVDA